jgi:hypothetical protein
MTLAHLVGILHYICKGPGFELWSSHLSTLRVEFLATRLLDKKKLIKIEKVTLDAFDVGEPNIETTMSPWN